MLDPVAQLRKNAVRNIPGVLCAEIDTYALGADELDYLLYFLNKHLRRVVEEQMRLVKEEYHLGL